MSSDMLSDPRPMFAPASFSARIGAMKPRRALMAALWAT